MRFLQGKEAVRLVRRGVRALTKAEKKRLGLSETNTYYVRSDLRRPSKRSAVATSRQVRQARAKLGLPLTEMAKRVRGRAGRRRRTPRLMAEALERANRDYQQGRISLDQAREQAQEWIERSRASRQVLTRIVFDDAESVTWYKKSYKDGTQFVINWVNRSNQMTREVQVERIVRIINSLDFNLIGYSAFELAYSIKSGDLVWSGWVSSVTVERDTAVYHMRDVAISGNKEIYNSLHLFYVLLKKTESVTLDFGELTVRISYFNG
jgi:hypothetical protein